MLTLLIYFARPAESPPGQRFVSGLLSEDAPNRRAYESKDLGLNMSYRDRQGVSPSLPQDPLAALLWRLTSQRTGN